MHILFDEAGKLMTGRLMSEAESSLQVELDSGKRVKVKTANALLRFEKPAPAQLMPAATALAATMELELAYEFAPEDEFGFADLATDYFSDPATTEQQVAALICLQGAPHYFRRAGKGRYKKAPAEIVAQALAAIEKKKQIQAQIDAWAAELVAGTCPEPVRAQLYKILFKPDKNAPEYKAVVEAARSSHLNPLALLEKAGAISSAYQFHWQRFLFDQFPKGTGFPALQAPAITDELPVAAVQAFSIDDSHTTEIDDALSLQGLGSGTVTLGIHIAAPGLAIKPDDAIDHVARQRLSTVYMPGHKITMLPDEVVQRYTLEAGRDCPAVSLYVSFDEATLELKDSRTALERVPIAHNLRHDQLDSVITDAWLTGDTPVDTASAEIATLQPTLAFLFRLAKHLKAQREVVRGKPETFTRPDYTFKLHGVTGGEPDGSETVVIGTRSRGAPLDLMVAEAMILANSHWGQWLAACGVPGIYRSQASLAPGVKVRMGTKVAPHAGIGVKAYAWSTSPLRRYVDLVNQWQIIACARHGTTAALAAPFKPKDANLFAVISGFDAAYTAYNGFQNGMERFWTLKHLQQTGTTELTATLIKDNLVRADTLPLVLPVLGAEGLPRGAHVRVRLGAIDEIALDVSGTVIERLDGPVGALDESADAEDEELATPLALAIDVNEAEVGAADPAAS
ncbi:ribonuclease catalytic domain-containing protein [Hydrogenophaga flava]|uniref:ribonuclease catalytic domain-containing protein n=1 Tax=Hydrogenophaga flava TaxID=65657 RepID=UPI000826F4E8|nr:ribonuclease catalytic domain-containing protein [Hydrogenophaga flava]